MAEDSGDASGAWSRTVSVVSLSIALVTMVYGVVTPFIPLYLSRELGVSSESERALWTGVVAGAIPLTVMVASPFWGRLADRFGRKTMLVRATAWAGCTYVLSGFVQQPLQLVGVRVLHGAASGVGTASTSLVAAEAPRSRVAYALGVLSGGRAIGSAAGPAIGGIAATFLPLRLIFVVAGLVQIGSAVIVALWVSERRRSAAAPTSIRTWVAGGGPGKTRAVVVLMAATALTQFAFAAAQQLVALRMIELEQTSAAVTTGVAFTCLSLSSVGAAAVYSKLVPALGLQRISSGAALLAAMALWLAAAASDPLPLIGATAIFGLGYGAAGPAISAMLSLEAPAVLIASVFGIAGSVFVLGTALGPLLGGIIAAFAGTGAALAVAGVAIGLAAVAIGAGGREPVE